MAGRDVLGDLERSLHPVSASLVIPVFALANTGVDLRGGALGHPPDLGRDLGSHPRQIIGIGGVTFLVRRLRWGTLPARTCTTARSSVSRRWAVGFTVSLFTGAAPTSPTKKDRPGS